MAGSFFIDLLKTGQIVAEDGTFMFLNEYFLLMPVRTFLKLREKLIEKLGKKADDIFKEMGRYQVAQAIKRYSKTIGIEKLDQVKINEFGVNVMNLMGHGVFEIVDFNEKEKKVVTRSKNMPSAIEYSLLYGKSKNPIDSYICGIWEEAYTRLFGTEMFCAETKCMACGDSFCQFEIKPIKKVRQ
jgi:predicted hydrocarbon binding protein